MVIICIVATTNNKTGLPCQEKIGSKLYRKYNKKYHFTKISTQYFHEIPSIKDVCIYDADLDKNMITGLLVLELHHESDIFQVYNSK